LAFIVRIYHVARSSECQIRKFKNCSPQQALLVCSSEGGRGRLRA